MNILHVTLHWVGPGDFDYPDATKMLSEPHRLLAQVGDSYVVGRQCECERCARLTGAGAEEIDPAELAELLIPDVVPLDTEPSFEVEIVLTEEMFALLADGSATYAVTYANSLGAAIAARGVDSRLVTPNHPEPYPEGTWLRVVHDDARLGIQHLLVEDMIGQVLPLPPWMTCTPGVSVWVHMEGRKDPAGYGWEHLAPMEVPPTEEELAHARQLCANAVELFQARNGWFGYLLLGGKIIPEAKARFEIQRLLEKLPELWQAGKMTDYAGNNKRLAKLLRGFALHPNGDALEPLAAALEAGTRSAPQPEVLEGVSVWLNGTLETGGASEQR